MSDKLLINESSLCTIVKRPLLAEMLAINGIYHVKCFDKDGNLKWEDTAKNLVTTLGKNLILDTVLAGAGYSVTGPYMGLISSVGYTGILAADTMVSHAGWAEAGSGSNYPLYTGDRKTCVFGSAAAGSKALSSALEFTIVTTGGTIKGCFIVFGSGASATIANTGGTLLSVVLFTGGDKIVGVGDIVQVSYSINLNA